MHTMWNRDRIKNGTQTNGTELNHVELRPRHKLTDYVINTAGTVDV